MIYVDANEYAKSSKVYDELKNLGVSAEVKPLRVGDYLIVSDSLYLIERKTIADFVNSVNSGHLTVQLRNAKTYNVANDLILLIEGNCKYVEYRKFNVKRFVSLIHGLSDTYKLMFLPDFRWSAIYISWLASKVKKSNVSESEFFRKTASKRMTLDERVLYVAQGFAGVKTAEKLLRVKGSIKGIVNSTFEELIKIDGIGAKTARNLVELFNHDFKGEYDEH